MNHQELYDKTVKSIKPVSRELIDKAFQRLDSLTKPRRSLGYLEDIAARVVAILQQEHPELDRKGVFVFVGDHKVVEEGVSAYPSEVTGLMVKNFLAGGAAINVLAKRAGAEVRVVDIGMAEEMDSVPGLLGYNVKRGADNIARGPAMSVDEALQAIGKGIQLAHEAADRDMTLMATGEMGIGNTTPASALFSLLLNLPVSELVGPGTGLDARGVKNKVKVVEKAIGVNRSLCTGVLETVAALGGLEIAGICGLCLGGAARSRPVVIDGFISSAGALAALRMCPSVTEYLFFAHMSAEPGHRKFFEQEKLRPIIDLGMRLGEGTGAVMAMQVIEDAVAIYNEMATFGDAGITPGA